MSTRHALALLLLSGTGDVCMCVKSVLRPRCHWIWSYEDMRELEITMPHTDTHTSGVLKRGQESNFQFTVEWEMWPSLEGLKHPSPSLSTQWVERWPCTSICVYVFPCVCTCLRSISGKNVRGWRELFLNSKATQLLKCDLLELF